MHLNKQIFSTKVLHLVFVVGWLVINNNLYSSNKWQTVCNKRVNLTKRTIMLHVHVH